MVRRLDTAAARLAATWSLSPPAQTSNVASSIETRGGEPRSLRVPSTNTQGGVRFRNRRPPVHTVIVAGSSLTLWRCIAAPAPRPAPSPASRTPDHARAVQLREGASE